MRLVLLSFFIPGSPDNPIYVFFESKNCMLYV